MNDSFNNDDFICGVQEEEAIWNSNQSTSILDKSGKNTKIPIDDSIYNVTETANILGNEATSTIKLKQSFTHDSSSNFSSPCGIKFIPPEKLIDTETINRYIRMESLSPNDTFSEDRNKSAFTGEETTGYIDVEEAELSTKNFDHAKTSSCKSSVSSVIEQSLINNHKLSDSDDNVCTLKPCSQQEDEDISYCYDSEFEDNVEYSIIPDKYSITPGKQRLFDSRHAKSSIRAKTVVSSAPFMDKIEENTTPLSAALNSSPIPIHDVSYGSLQDEDIVDRTSVSSWGRKSSAVYYNQTSNDWDLKSKKYFNETMEELSQSTIFNHSVSESDTINCVNDRKSAILNMESSLHDSEVEQTHDNNLQNKSTLTNHKTTIGFDMPLNIVNESLTNTSNISKHIFDTEKSMNSLSNIDISMANIEDYNDEKVSEAVLTDIKSTNNSVLDTVFNETMSTSLLFSNGKNEVSDKSHNRTNQTKCTSNIAELSFEVNNSMINMSNIMTPMVDINDCNYEEESEAMEVDINSTNTSVVDNTVDETMCNSMLSTNDKHKDFNTSSNETSQAKNTLNVAEQSFDVEKSICCISNIMVPNTEINGFIGEESEAMEVDIKSTNTSVVDNIVDETMFTNMFSTNDESKNLNKSLNETSQAKDTLNVAEQSFGIEKSMNVMSDIIVPTPDANRNDKEESDAKVAHIESNNTSVVDNVFDETMCTSMLFTNNKSKVLNKSSNEIIQAKDTSNVTEQSFGIEKSTNVTSNDISQDQNTLNVVEQSFGIEKSMNVTSNIIVPTADANNCNNKEESDAKIVDIESNNTSVVDNIFDETMYTSMLFSDNKSKVLNKSSNEIIQAIDTFNAAEQSFSIEKSMNVTSNEFSQAQDTLNVAEHSFGIEESANVTSNKIRPAHDILNVAEQSFGIEKSMNVTSKIIVSTTEADYCNDKEESDAKTADIESTNTSVLDNIFDEKMCSSSMLSTNNIREDLNTSLNETSQAKDTLNVAEQTFGIEKSMNVMSDIIVPTPDANHCNDKEESDAKVAQIVSTNTETSQTENTLNVAEQSINIKKSLDNIVVSSTNANDTSLLCKLKNNTLKCSIDVEIPCSKKVDNIFTNDISETNDNTSLNLSRGMRQYLEFEQTIYNMCNDISSDPNLNKSNIQGDQTSDNISLIEQILSSDSFVSMKDGDDFSSSNISLRPKLSVIIENRTLEENYNDTIEHNEHFDDMMTTSLSKKSDVNEIQDGLKLNKSTNQNQMESITFEDVSKSEMNETDNEFEMKTESNKSIIAVSEIESGLPLCVKNTNCDITLDENLDKTKNINDELSKTEPCLSTKVKNYLNNEFIEKHVPVSKEAEKICLDKNDLQQPLIPENITSNLDVIAIKCTQNLANVNKNSSNFEQNRILNNDVQQLELLSAHKRIYDDSLDEYKQLEEMFNSEENNKLQTFDYKTPKVQKLLDFSIMQQTPTFANQVQKQKLLNFSIVDQTPKTKSTQPTYLDENVTGKKDSLIDFSAVDQIWDSDVTLPDKIDFKDFQNSSKVSMLKNLSEISAPDLELLADESVITNSSCHNNSSLNQTITDSSNQFSSTYPDKTNESKDSIDEKNSGETNVKSSDKDHCSMLSVNEQIKTDEPSSSLDKTIEKIDMEFSYTTESKQNKSCKKSCLNDTTTGAKYQSKCSSNITLNHSFKKSDSTELVIDLNQKPTFNSNLCAIKDFSIIEEQTLQIPESKENSNSTLIGSNLNVSNLIEMSIVSNVDLKSNDQALVSSGNAIIVVTPDGKSEKSINSSSDENSTAIHIEEHIFSHNPEFLTDIQKNDISLLESSEKSLIGESFHSIESDQLQEDNKRKSEPDQEQQNNEKKMKVTTEEPSTPMSMLYKLRNMFKSSEKPPITKSNKENDFKSDKCHQKLNFSYVEENKDKSICYKKPEVLTKSKIPCKISDKSMSKTSEFNNSSSSLNDSIKPKKAIPKFIGAPVLSDVSNSSMRKCPESRIPSKFKK